MDVGYKVRKSRAVLLLLALVMLVSGGTLSGVGVQEAEAASTASNRTDYHLSGDHMIWMEPDASGNKQIWYQNYATGQKRAITTSTSAKDAPYINGDIIVWADKGSEDPASLNWDIYSYSLSSGVQKKLNRVPGQFSNPTTDGIGVLWFDRYQYGEMLYHDLATGIELRLGEGKFPVLAKGIVVYQHARDGGLSMLTLSTGVRRPLINLGSPNNVDWFVTNGDYVLWRQKDGRSGSKFVTMALRTLGSQPVDVSQMTEKTTEYAFMEIGDTKAIFIEQVNGQPMFKEVNLTTSSVSNIAEPGAGRTYIGFNGDRLVYSTPELTYGIVGEETVPPGSSVPAGNGASGGSSSTGSSSTKADAVQAVIGASGGKLSSVSGKAVLEIAAGALSADTKLSLSNVGLTGKQLRDEKGRTLGSDSNVWQITADPAFTKQVKLSLGYDATGEWLTKREQLGIYKYEPAKSHWTYVGGITGAASGVVQTSIQEPGIYAVLLRQVSFGDLRAGHWAADAVQVLAARGIIDGMSENAFAPSGTLTRAQFTKLLASAMGIEPLYPSKPSFSDVDAKNWSYGWIEAAAAAGIVEGDNGTFRPNGAVTREQMMAMLMRASGSRLNTEGLAKDLSSYADEAKVSAWAKPLVADAVALQLIEGNGNKLDPRSTTTRAQAAVVIYRLLGKLELL